MAFALLLLVIDWLNTICCEMIAYDQERFLMYKVEYIPGQSDGTDDFLASYAVAASSLLPPSAKTSMDKITHVNALW